MKMLWCSLLFPIVLLIKEISAQDVIPRTTYTSATLEMECEIASGAIVVTWTETMEGGGSTLIFTFDVNSGNITDSRQNNDYVNFGYTENPTSFYNLIITNVAKDDGGTYQCANIPVPDGNVDFVVDVEVPGTVSIKNGSQDVDTLTVTFGNVYDITCSATGTKSNNALSFDWEPELEGGTPESQTNDLDGDLTDYFITSAFAPKKEDRSIKCQLTGYNTQDEIKDLVLNSISVVVQYKPECSLMVAHAVDSDCSAVTLTCTCTAVPDVQKYSFFNGSSSINNASDNSITVNVDYDSTSQFSCQASNAVGTGEQSNEEDHQCEEGTTPNPLTSEMSSSSPDFPSTEAGTITTVTNDFSTEAPSESSTKESVTDDKGGEAPIVLIIVLCCVGLIVICAGGGVAVYCVKRDGKGCSSNSHDETSIDLESKETAVSKETSEAEYAVPNKKKKSNKPDGNGAGPENDPPTYAAVDKPQPTAAPRTSQKGPEPDGMELQYADLDHTGKPATSEIRKPQDEPTEYATVQSVIV